MHSMRHVSFFIYVVFLWAGAICTLPTILCAQRFEVPFNPAKPLILEHPEENLALCLFTADRVSGKSVSTARVFACDKTTLTSSKHNDLLLPVSGESDGKLRRLCRAARAKNAFFVTENDDVCRAYRLSWSDLTAATTDSVQARKGEHFLTGLSDGPYACVISYQDAKKEGRHFRVYSLNEEGRLELHDFPVPAVFEDDFDDIFKKSYHSLSPEKGMRPLAVQYNMEHDPESAARYPKLFIGEDMVWLAYDAEVKGGYEILKLYTFDLTKDSVWLKRYDYGSGAVQTRGKGSSYIYDGKIFQLSSSPSHLQIAVRDLWTGNILRFQHHGIDDSLNFANSPVLIPGRGTFGIEKEYADLKKFIRRYKSFSPSLQVRRYKEDYVLCIGGYERIQTGGAMRMNPATGVWTGGTGFSYERVCAFYTALNAKNLFHSNTYFQRTLASYYAEMEKAFDGVTDEAILHISGSHYLGRYLTDRDVYTLQKIGE